LPETETLLTVAEVAVAFAGFASLVSILGRGTADAHPKILSLRMRAMLISSLLVVGYALVPVIVHGYGARPHMAWVVSSVMMLVTTLYYYGWLQHAIVTLGRFGLTPSRFQRRVIIPTLLLTLLVVSVLLLTNVMLAMPAIYLTALALLLFQSGFAFCLIVFSFLPSITQDDLHDDVDD
jgi:hypothetical protein